MTCSRTPRKNRAFSHPHQIPHGVCLLRSQAEAGTVRARRQSGRSVSLIKYQSVWQRPILAFINSPILIRVSMKYGPLVWLLVHQTLYLAQSWHDISLVRNYIHRHLAEGYTNGAPRFMPHLSANPLFLLSCRLFAGLSSRRRRRPLKIGEMAS